MSAALRTLPDQPPRKEARMIEVLQPPVAPRRPPAGTSMPAAVERPTLLGIDDVHKTYRQGQMDVQALRGVSMNVHERELLAICGPSGSGKTTLLNLIGLIDTPTSGQVSMAGQALGGLSSDRLARLRSQEVGFVFQSFNLLPVLSAFENLLLPLQLQGRVKGAQRERALRLLDDVGLSAQAHARPDHLSGGQRQRVAIARALVTQPSLVIADEPTANLDTESTEQVMELFHALNRTHGVTFVFSTHDSRVIERVDRCVWLKDGCLQTLNR
jgi:putative ABC transport system ATP-binding protein